MLLKPKRTNKQVEIIVFRKSKNKDFEFLILKRNEERGGFWQPLTGGVKQGESFNEALMRELCEETGINDIEIIKPLSMFHIFRKNEKKAENELMGISYWCKTRTAEVRLSDEHTNYKWFTPEEALKLADRSELKRYLKIQMQEKKFAEKIDFHEHQEDK